ncbi:hypothetical protein [Caballeronia glebae]|uniref:hypothetical protein n=1 Tax=Caballeronia glebae TaxID=1777143 RepID=UPI0038B83AA7
MIGEAIVDALALDDPSPGTATIDPRASDRVIVLLCAEQGFVGTLNEYIVTSLGVARRTDKTANFVMGTRGEAVAREHRLAFGWGGPMRCSACAGPALARRPAQAFSSIASRMRCMTGSNRSGQQRHHD